jgi:3-oxoacyl-[acyl-carrier-protein] synthase-3
VSAASNFGTDGEGAKRRAVERSEGNTRAVERGATPGGLRDRLTGATRGAAITGCGAALPEKTLHNADLARRLDVSEEWIFERTGITSRHIASEGETTSSLATSAAMQALERASVGADELDTIIVATCTPDFQLPATAPLVQAALGAGAGAFDVGAGCSGFLYALVQANALIESRAARKVLVCGADVLSRITNYSDARSCVLFGDGAGAVVVEAIEGASRLGPFRLHSDGSRPELLYIPPDDKYMHMEGREVYRRAVEGMTASVREVLEDAHLGVDDVDLLVAHQANARILEAVAQRLGLRPEQSVMNIALLGNTSAASIPLALAEASERGRLDDDDLVLLAAFGAGFVWGAGVVRWGPRAQRDAEPAFAGEARA